REALDPAHRQDSRRCAGADRQSPGGGPGSDPAGAVPPPLVRLFRSCSGRSRDHSRRHCSLDLPARSDPPTADSPAASSETPRPKRRLRPSTEGVKRKTLKVKRGTVRSASFYVLRFTFYVD